MLAETHLYFRLDHDRIFITTKKAPIATFCVDHNCSIFLNLGQFHKTVKQELRLKFYLKRKVYSYSVSQNLKLKSKTFQEIDSWAIVVGAGEDMYMRLFCP